ncbi:MAG: hypothetical protein U0U67_04510 [Chitinophagales bacterium]
MQTLLFFSLSIFILTEILSFFNALTHANVTITWLMFDILFLIYKLKKINSICSRLFTDVRYIIKNNKTNSVLISSIIVPLAFLCYFVPPNNNDSMLYHMARIPFWIFNKNVNFFPTMVGMQLYYNPLAEYQILQLELLTNSIRYANFVQFFAMLGSCIAVSLIVKKMNGNQQSQLIGFLLTLTLPLGIFQATSTQNDFVVGFFMITAFYYLIKLFYDAIDYKSVILFGISMALCGLTKFSGWIFIFPFLVFYGIKSLYKYKVVFFMRMLIAVAITILLLLPFVMRNMRTFDSPLGAKNKTELSSNLQNDDFSFKQISSNTLKHIAILSVVPVNKINKIASKILEKTHLIFGWQLNPEKEIKFGNTFSNRFVFHEDTISNFIPFLLFLFSVFLLFIYKNKAIIIYFILLFSGIILFSASIRWQVWNGRLFLPWFLLLIPYLTLAYKKWFENKIIRLLILTPIVLFAYICVFINPSKSIIPINKNVPAPAFLSDYDLAIMQQKSPELLSSVFNQYKALKMDSLHCLLYNNQVRSTTTFKDSLNMVLNFPKQFSIYDKSYTQRMYWMDFTYYRMMRELCSKVDTKNASIGIALSRGLPEYYIYYFLLHDCKNVNAIYNIAFPKVLINLANTKKEFQYQYLITNNAEVINKLNPNEILTSYDFGMVHLYKFKSIQHKKYIVTDLFNEVTKKF